MKKYFHFLLIFLSLTFLIAGCKKRETTFYIQDSFKQWVLFKKGSYWVYLNEKTNLQDSIYINSDPTIDFLPLDQDVPHYESIKYVFNNGFVRVGFINASNDENCFYAIQDFQSYNICLTNNIVTGESNRVSYRCWLVNRIDSLTVNNHNFSNVILMRDSAPSGGDFIMKDYYFAKNIGLLKFSIKSSSIDSTWSLMRWSAIQ